MRELPQQSSIAQLIQLLIILLAFVWAMTYEVKAQTNFTFEQVNDSTIMVEDYSNSPFIGFQVIGNCYSYITPTVIGGNTYEFVINNLPQQFAVRKLNYYGNTTQSSYCWQFNNVTQSPDTVIINIPNSTYEVNWYSIINNKLIQSDQCPDGVKIINTLVYNLHTLQIFVIDDYFDFNEDYTYHVISYYKWQDNYFLQYWNI